MKQFLIASLLVASAAAQPAIQAPQLGFSGDTDGTLRPVYGVTGSFILGPAVVTKVISQAFSGSLGLLKTDAALVAFDGQGRVLATMDAAPGPALFAFSPDGVTALAYVASNNTLVAWSGGKFSTVPFRPEPGAVVAIAMPSAFEAALIVERNDDLWEVGATSLKALPGVSAPVLALASGDLVYSDASGIVLRRPDNAEVHVAAKLPAKFSLQQMGSDWVQLADLGSGRRFAIRILSGHEGFYELPEAAR